MFGLVLNCCLFLFSLFFGALLGVPMGIFRATTPLVIRAPVSAALAVLRSTPLLFLVLWIFLFIQVVLAIPLTPAWIGAIALSVYAMVHISDIVRAGAKAVSRDLIRTAQSLGLNRVQVARHVILPVSFRVMIPTFTSFATSLFKDTSVCYVIGVIEIMQLGVMESTRNPEYLIHYYALIALIFFVINVIGSRLACRLEQRLKIPGTLA